MLKRVLIPLVASGGLAAALFGGSAVSTAFTADTPTHATAAADTVNQVVSGSISADNLLPGGTEIGSLNYSNTGNTPTHVYLVPTSWSRTMGTDGSYPNTSDLTFTIDAPGRTITIQGSDIHMGQPISLFDAPVGGPWKITVQVGLSQGAGNDWNGAKATLDYTLHAQDVSGLDANGYVATSNN